MKLTRGGGQAVARSEASGERAGSARCGSAKAAGQVRAIGIATLLGLLAVLVRAVADLSVQHARYRYHRAVLRQQPRH